MSYDQSQVAFIDTETTGLDPERDHVWEIAVIVDGVEHVWQQALPGGRDGWPDYVHRWVLENTGIRERYDWDAALAGSDSTSRLIELVDGRHLVGACPWFDSDRLHRTQLFYQSTLRHTNGVPYREVWGRDLRWHYHLIDVENMAVGYLTAKLESSDAGVLFIPDDLLLLGEDDELAATLVDFLDQPGDVTPPMVVLGAADDVERLTAADVRIPLPWKSENLSRMLGVDPDDFQPKHTALTDARWAKAMYEAMMGAPR